MKQSTLWEYFWVSLTPKLLQSFECQTFSPYYNIEEKGFLATKMQLIKQNFKTHVAAAVFFGIHSIAIIDILGNFCKKSIYEFVAGNRSRRYIVNSSFGPNKLISLGKLKYQYIKNHCADFSLLGGLSNSKVLNLES